MLTSVGRCAPRPPRMPSLGDKVNVKSTKSASAGHTLTHLYKLIFLSARRGCYLSWVQYLPKSSTCMWFRLVVEGGRHSSSTSGGNVGRLEVQPPHCETSDHAISARYGKNAYQHSVSTFEMRAGNEWSQ